MEILINLLVDSIGKVWISFSHNWPFLLASVLISVGLKLYIRPEKIKAFLTRYRKAGVLGSTAAAVATPFCSCGTTAVILGMIASTIPWAPIVAFMVASPLTSPEELVYSAGLFGWPFAIAFFVSSILLGLLGGVIAEFFEARGWLANQARFALQPAQKSALVKDQVAAFSAINDQNYSRERVPMLILEPAMAAVPEFGPVSVVPASACGCDSSEASIPPSSKTCECGSENQAPDSGSEAQTQETSSSHITWQLWFGEMYQTGGKLLLMFLGFAFLGYMLNGLIPQAWVSALFGKGNMFSVPLAAVLGLPLYINTEGSLPLVRSLIDGGMSQGAALAFLITGAGTSIGAIGGALTIARWRVITLVIATLLVGSVVLGVAYNFLLAAHLF
jgi:uncharacterized membrane protein YraQ (UPF0718 family)